MIGWKKLYARFLAHLELLDADVGHLELLRHIQAWLKGSLNNWSPELRKDYGLDEYAILDFERFPLADASFSPGVTLQQLRTIPPGSMDTFASFLGNVFWEGITVESSVRCPHCGHTALRILEDPVTGEVVLACDLCTSCQTENGEPWEKKTYYLRPATKELVARSRSRSSWHVPTETGAVN